MEISLREQFVVKRRSKDGKSMKKVKGQPKFQRHTDALNWIKDECKLGEYVISSTFFKEDLSLKNKGVAAPDRDSKVTAPKVGKN